MSKDWKFGDVIRQGDNIAMVLAPNTDPRHRNEEWYQVLGLRDVLGRNVAYAFGEIDPAFADWWERVDD